MTHNQPTTGSSKRQGGYFEHERLDAYRHSRQALQFVASRRAALRGLPGKVGEQLERAIVGAHTNLCSGASAEGAEKRRLFRIALSEGGEAGGCVDAALDYGALSPGEYETLRQLLLRLCACLRGLSR
jgi:hypothetical protein